MTSLQTMITEDLLAVAAYRRATFTKREADAQRSNLRSDRALADEAYTSLYEAMRVLKERGIDG
jgi:hypothetical protein